MAEDNKKLFDAINNVLSKVDLSDVSAESSGSKDLPEGYYLSEVTSAELRTSKSSGNPMVALTLKTVSDGLANMADENGNAYLTEIKKTADSFINIYYPLKDEKSVKRYVADMLKFEGDEEGVPLLPKDAFTTAEVLHDALEILIGQRIYVQVSVSTTDDGSKAVWQNLISWKRAASLELPC